MFFYTCFPVITASVAAAMDLLDGKVDNGWILFCMGTGLVFRILAEGIRAVPLFAAGMIFPFICLWGLFVFRMLGAGDIKLFCALGGIMGIQKIGSCILVSFSIGAVISLGILISNGDLGQRLQYLAAYIRELRHTGKIRPYYKKGLNASENFHFTVPVFLSVVLYAGGVY